MKEMANIFDFKAAYIPYFLSAFGEGGGRMF
jgi:hypothetical protein